MDIIKIFQRFPDHEACLEHLERVRWSDTPACPYCGAVHVARKADGARAGRWNCHACKSSFNVLAGTIFQKTKIPLQKWFLAISIILNAKKSVASYQLARDLELNQKTAWYIGTRIRLAMVGGDKKLLTGIVEADESYIGGKPRKRNIRSDDKPSSRRRGTSKLPIVGAVERAGHVTAEPSPQLDSRALAAFIGRNVERDSLLITDEYKGYRGIGRRMRHATINHSARYADGLTHTNTIEGFWSLIKRAWYGTHHHYSRKHAAAYVTEACYKYKNRKASDPFSAFIRAAVVP